MTQYWLIINCRRFGGVCCSYLQGSPRKSMLCGRNGCIYFFPQLTVPTKVKLKMVTVSSSEASETINQYGVISHRTSISSYITYINIQIYFCRWQILIKLQNRIHILVCSFQAINWAYRKSCRLCEITMWCGSHSHSPFRTAS